MIGNSHVAAMRFAWDEIADRHPGVEVDIFAQHALNLASAGLLEGGRLSPGEKPFWQFSRGTEATNSRSINLGHYDAFVLVGLAFGPITVFRTYRRYHFFGLQAKRAQGLPRARFKQAVWQAVEEGAALHIARLIRRHTDKPVIVLETPLPSEKGYDDSEKGSMLPWREAAANGDSGPLMELYREICADMEAEGIVIVPQAPETLASPISTFQRFADNAPRTRGAADVRPEDDYQHMNTPYGEVMWSEALARLTGLGVIPGTTA